MTSFETALADWNRGITAASWTYQLETTCFDCGGWRDQSRRIGRCKSCRDKRLRKQRKNA